MDLVYKNTTRTIQIFKDKKGNHFLMSYSSWIAKWDGKKYTFTDKWDYSPTTRHHLGYFMKHYGAGAHPGRTTQEIVNKSKIVDNLF